MLAAIRSTPQTTSSLPLYGGTVGLLFGIRTGLFPKTQARPPMRGSRSKSLMMEKFARHSVGKREADGFDMRSRT